MPKRTAKGLGSTRKRKKAPAEEYWEVQSLLDCRKKPDTGEYEYLIRWKNWDGDDTWEPEANLSEAVKKEAKLVKSQYLEQLRHQQVDDTAQSSAPKDSAGDDKATEDPSEKVEEKVEDSTPDGDMEVKAPLPSSQGKSPPRANSSVSTNRTSRPASRHNEPQTQTISIREEAAAPVESGGHVAAAAADEPKGPADDSMLIRGENPDTKGLVDEAATVSKSNISEQFKLNHTPGKNVPPIPKSPDVASSASAAQPLDDVPTSRDEGSQQETMPSERKAVPIAREAKRLRGHWTMIVRDLETKLAEKDPATVQALAELCPSSMYPTLEPTEHCVLCHKSFDPRFPEGCKMLHVIEKWTPSEVPGDDVYYGQCSRCNESWEASKCYMETLSKSSCFERTHTSDIKERLSLSLEHDNVQGKRRAAAQKASSLKPFDGCFKCIRDSEGYR